ncbi:MAG TPA: helix-turn-helix domain-containing protein [Vicinamibacteria bacterium]|nr:helix-turn-helix domain-containing protein [Vicinamibacteria bacterium]
MIQTRTTLQIEDDLAAEDRLGLPGAAPPPTLTTPDDPAASVFEEVLPKTLGRKIHQGLKLITGEAQELAEELRLGLGQYERELLISALEASRRHRSRSPKATLNTLPDRLSRRIRRLQLTADNVNSLVGSLVENLKRRLEVNGRDPGGPPSERVDLKTRLEEYERELVISALEACGMNQVLAAKELGVLPTTLSEKMKRLGLRGRGRAWRG